MRLKQSSKVLAALPNVARIPPLISLKIDAALRLSTELAAAWQNGTQTSVRPQIDAFALLRRKIRSEIPDDLDTAVIHGEKLVQAGRKVLQCAENIRVIQEFLMCILHQINAMQNLLDRALADSTENDGGPVTQQSTLKVRTALHALERLRDALAIRLAGLLKHGNRWDGQSSTTVRDLLRSWGLREINPHCLNSFPWADTFASTLRVLSQPSCPWAILSPSFQAVENNEYNQYNVCNAELLSKQNIDNSEDTSADKPIHNAFQCADERGACTYPLLTHFRNKMPQSCRWQAFSAVDEVEPVSLQDMTNMFKICLSKLQTQNSVSTSGETNFLTDFHKRANSWITKERKLASSHLLSQVLTRRDLMNSEVSTREIFALIVLLTQYKHDLPVPSAFWQNLVRAVRMRKSFFGLSNRDNPLFSGISGDDCRSMILCLAQLASAYKDHKCMAALLPRHQCIPVSAMKNGANALAGSVEKTTQNTWPPGGNYDEWRQAIKIILEPSIRKIPLKVGMSNLIAFAAGLNTLGVHSKDFRRRLLAEMEHGHLSELSPGMLLTALRCFRRLRIERPESLHVFISDYVKKGRLQDFNSRAILMFISEVAHLISRKSEVDAILLPALTRAMTINFETLQSLQLKTPKPGLLPLVENIPKQDISHRDTEISTLESSQPRTTEELFDASLVDVLAAIQQLNSSAAFQKNLLPGDSYKSFVRSCIALLMLASDSTRAGVELGDLDPNILLLHEFIDLLRFASESGALRETEEIIKRHLVNALFRGRIDFAACLDPHSLQYKENSTVECNAKNLLQLAMRSALRYLRSVAKTQLHTELVSTLHPLIHFTLEHSTLMTPEDCRTLLRATAKLQILPKLLLKQDACMRLICRQALEVDNARDIRSIESLAALAPKVIAEAVKQLPKSLLPKIPESVWNALKRKGELLTHGNEIRLLEESNVETSVEQK